MAKNKLETNKLIHRILTLASKGGEGHVPSSLSILDIIDTLYEKFITKNKLNKFVLSKGHGCLSFYAVLEKYSMDFCCRGSKTLNESCIEKNIPLDDLLAELALSIIKNETSMPFAEMSAEQLVSYIQIHHHFYVRNNIPTIKNHLEKIVSKHGPKYPNMIKVAELFNEVAAELLPHMDKGLPLRREMR